MGRYIGPQCRLCRTEKKKMFLKGERCYSAKCPIAKKRGAPGKGLKDRTKKLSDYGVMMREKQKIKRLYGMLEKQFKLTFNRASKLPGKTGENLMILLERRLDNVVYRMRFASSRKQARQLVSHGHVSVNGKTVTIASFSVKATDAIAIRDNSKKMVAVKESLKELGRSGSMPWISVDPDNMTGQMLALPRRSDMTDLADMNEQLVVELYSK
jgi:small subunit ribosomal protein S4